VNGTPPNCSPEQAAQSNGWGQLGGGFSFGFPVENWDEFVALQVASTETMPTYTTQYYYDLQFVPAGTEVVSLLDEAGVPFGYSSSLMGWNPVWMFEGEITTAVPYSGAATPLWYAPSGTIVSFLPAGENIPVGSRTIPSHYLEQSCNDEYLMNNGGPGAQQLVTYLSAYNSKQGLMNTLGAEAARWGLWGLGKVLENSTLTVAGETGGLGSFAISGAATVMDARARHACGESIIP